MTKPLIQETSSTRIYFRKPCHFVFPTNEPFHYFARLNHVTSAWYVKSIYPATKYLKFTLFQIPASNVVYN